VNPQFELDRQIEGLCQTGAMFHQRGWSLGTSSNYSVVLDRQPLVLLITASGKDKGRLTPADFVRVDRRGEPIVPGQPKSSAETLLHVAAAETLGAGAVLHTHSVWGTLLSEHFFPQRGFRIEGYEMLKGLDGVATHEHSEWVEIFDNTQDIAALAERVRPRLADSDRPLKHGYLILRHGLYTWGRDLAEARRHVEIFEFLFECVGRSLCMANPNAGNPKFETNPKHE
jgi:methylthioribulose-1-phosphate dehydratase